MEMRTASNPKIASFDDRFDMMSYAFIVCIALRSKSITIGSISSMMYNLSHYLEPTEREDTDSSVTKVRHSWYHPICNHCSQPCRVFIPDPLPAALFLSALPTISLGVVLTKLLPIPVPVLVFGVIIVCIEIIGRGNKVSGY